MHDERHVTRLERLGRRQPCPTGADHADCIHPMRLAQPWLPVVVQAAVATSGEDFEIALPGGHPPRGIVQGFSDGEDSGRLRRRAARGGEDGSLEAFLA